MIEKLNAAEKIINGSKINKFINHPISYTFNFVYLKLMYPFSKRGIILSTKTFFDTTICVNFPSAADIYIFGSKSHYSEIRLSRFMIKNLQKGDTFIDVGAHIGFFSLLAEKLVGLAGKIYSFEPSTRTFEMLIKNTKNFPNIYLKNVVCSDNNELISFYEFPLLYSEYNSFNIEQYRNEAWFIHNQPTKKMIESVVLGNVLPKENIKIVKIDVEGAEFKVLKGMKNLIESKTIKYFAMEYLNDNRDVSNHKLASRFLIENLYFPFFITDSGELEKIENQDIESYLNHKSLDSDNIVFKTIKEA